MRSMKALSGFLGLGVVIVFGGFHDAAAQQSPKATAAPSLVAWPLPASGQAYGSIDGKHIWQYVKEQSDIARRYRDNGHPQFWGRIAGTSGDVEAADWLLKKYQQI